MPNILARKSMERYADAQRAPASEQEQRTAAGEDNGEERNFWECQWEWRQIQMCV